MCGWTSATGLNSHHTQHLSFLISLRVQAHRRCLLSVCLVSVHSLWDLELLTSHGQFCRREALGLDTLPWGRVDTGRTSREAPFRENHQVEGMQSYPDVAQEIKQILLWQDHSRRFADCDGRWSDIRQEVTLVCRGRVLQQSVRSQSLWWTRQNSAGQGPKQKWDKHQTHHRRGKKDPNQGPDGITLRDL